MSQPVEHPTPSETATELATHTHTADTLVTDEHSTTEHANPELNGPKLNSTKVLARSPNLDAIRGFALLGILFLNIYYMGNVFYGYAPHQPQLALDVTLEVVSNIFLEGRFISLFSMLFGAGLFIQVQRAMAKQTRSASDVNVKLIKRRLKYLIVFGAIHGVFIFSGDILLTYGICGFLVLHYCHQHAQAQLKQAAKFFAIAVVLITTLTLTIEDAPYYRGSELYNIELTIWTGSYLHQVFMQAIMVGFMVLVLPFSTLWYCSALMLIGMALYQNKVFERGFNAQQLLALALLSVILSSIDSYLSFQDSAILTEISQIFMMLSALPMALIYLHIIVKLCQNNTLRLTALQKVGKMALSLYILQSIVGVMMLRHIMPQWQSEFDRIDYFVFVIGFSVIQLFIAKGYFMVFTQGPLEFLIRRWVKGKPATTD